MNIVLLMLYVRRESEHIVPGELGPLFIGFKVFISSAECSEECIVLIKVFK